MILIIIIMYITITVLSIITFGIKGSLVLLIISPLLIVYLNSNSINIKKKNIEKRNFGERKEVEFVSSRDRKKAISDGTKKKVPKKKTTTKSTNSSRKKENNKTERKNNIIGKEKFKDKSIRTKRNIGGFPHKSFEQTGALTYYLENVKILEGIGYPIDVAFKQCS